MHTNKDLSYRTQRDRVPRCSALVLPVLGTVVVFLSQLLELCGFLFEIERDLFADLARTAVRHLGGGLANAARNLSQRVGPHRRRGVLSMNLVPPGWPITDQSLGHAPGRPEYVRPRMEPESPQFCYNKPRRGELETILTRISAP
jgi:hypothetical protein